jgi:dihydrofolate reductase
MGTIILLMSVSLDGFIEGPQREIDWHLVDDELFAHFIDRLRPVGAFLDGRVTWELMASYWPTADAAPGAGKLTAEYAQIWRDKPKVVYSRTLQEAGWHTTIVREVVPDEVRALAARSDGDLAVGGAELAGEFIRQDLIDEYWIYVHPILIGQGKPLFPPDARASLRLLQTRSFGSGVVQLRYGRGRSRHHHLKEEA